MVHCSFYSFYVPFPNSWQAGGSGSKKNQKFNNRNDRLHPIVATRPFELIQMDHCGPFPTTEKGNNYVLTIVDHFSRKRWFIQTNSTTAEKNFKLLLQNIFQFRNSSHQIVGRHFKII